MKRKMISAPILKPEIDEETALRFASAGLAPASESSTDRLINEPSEKPAPPKRSSDNLEKGMRQISLTIKKSLYDRIAKEAARKNRTVEEHLKRHLTKRYEK